MIKRLKVQLSKSPHTLALLLLLPLGGFFFYNWHFAPRLFFFLAGSITIGIFYLVYSYFRLIHRQTAISLERGEYEERMNLTQAENIRALQANAALLGKIANYSLLKKMIEKLCASFTLVDTAHAMAEEVNALYGLRDMTVIVYRFHPNTNQLSLLSSLREHLPINLRAKKGDLYDQWVIKNLKPLLVEDTKSDFRFDGDESINEDQRPIRSLISVPLSVGEKTVGIIRVDSVLEHHFSSDDLRFLSTVGNIGAVALENAELYERVEDLAIRDSLTGVFLRRYLMDRLSHEMGRHTRRDAELSFLMIDLDHFKKYNDRFGHTAGDIALKTMAMILSDMFKEPGQIVCRYGGEEFCVLLPDCSKKKAGQLAEEVRKRIESQSILLRREKTRVTVSMGVATFPKDSPTREELIQKADTALYQAKAKGRNQVVMA